jgi:hypothetical protein
MEAVVSTDRLYAGLKGMLNQVGSTLLPSCVNTERLVRYTLVYYRARAQLRYWIPLFTSVRIRILLVASMWIRIRNLLLIKVQSLAYLSSPC